MAMKVLVRSHYKVLDYKLKNAKYHITENAASQLLVVTQEHNLDINNAYLHLNAEKNKYNIAMEAQIFDAVSKSKAEDKNHRLEMKAVKGQLKDGASNLKDEIFQSTSLR